ncbi:ATP-binding protein [Streptomyces sp. NPDC003483]
MTTTTIPRPSQSRTVVRAASAGERVFGLPLEHGPLAPATARHEARLVLTAWGLDEDLVYDTLLVISEMVTNAVTHALPPVVLHLADATTDTSGGVQVHVSDGGSRTAPTGWAATRPADEHGRGGTIINALASEAGAGPDAEGLIDHWADLAAA